jgi:hypothetical protein
MGGERGVVASDLHRLGVTADDPEPLATGRSFCRLMPVDGRFPPQPAKEIVWKTVLEGMAV